MSETPSPAIPIGRKLPEHALWEQLQRRAQPLALEFCRYFFKPNAEPSYARARKWLEEYGVKASINSLNNFYRSPDIRWKYASLEREVLTDSTADQLPADIKGANRRRVEQLMFEMLHRAMTDGQYMELIALQQNAEGMEGNFALKKQKLELDREKFEVQSVKLYLKWRKDRKMEELAESNLSQADKIAAMRQLAFSDVDALQQSGEIQLPKS